MVGEIMKCYLCEKDATMCTPWGDYICIECNDKIINENVRIASLGDKNRCIELEHAVYDLLNIIEREEKIQLPQFYFTLKVMRKNLKICIENDFEDVDVLFRFLNEDWTNCLNIHGGVNDWHIHRTKYEEKIEVNKQLEKIKNTIDKLIDFKNNERL